MSCSLIIFQMMRVISSPSSSTTVPSTLILDMWATLQGSASRSVERRVERLARPHHRRGLVTIGVVVATDFHRIPLHLRKFGHDGVLTLRQGLGQFGEMVGQFLVLGLLGELLRPVQGQVVLATTVVELTGLA